MSWFGTPVEENPERTIWVDSTLERWSQWATEGEWRKKHGDRKEANKWRVSKQVTSVGAWSSAPLGAPRKVQNMLQNCPSGGWGGWDIHPHSSFQSAVKCSWGGLWTPWYFTLFLVQAKGPHCPEKVMKLRLVATSSWELGWWTQMFRKCGKCQAGYDNE